ncbi:MAG: hypothetical protein KBG64_08380 [Clostridia bacterium]|nr:hypothetical protein [Clostridia bacterium]
MDFLEGFLLGPIWSDTEYETRRHAGLYWFIGWLAFAGYIWLQFKPPWAQPWLSLPRWVPILIFFFLLFSSPFMNCYYYRMNILVKLLILAFQAIKLAAAFLALYQWILPYYSFDIDLLPQEIIEYINQTITKSTETFATIGQAVGMLIGLIAGALQIILTFLCGLLTVTLGPAFYLFLIQMLQRVVDRIAYRKLLPHVDL